MTKVAKLASINRHTSISGFTKFATELLLSSFGVSFQYVGFLRQCLLQQISIQCFDAVGWAVGRASERQKTEWWGAGVVICLEWGADLHMAQLMSMPLTVSCFSEIQTGFTFLLSAHLGSSGQRAFKRVCVRVSYSRYTAIIKCNTSCSV